METTKSIKRPRYHPNGRLIGTSKSARGQTFQWEQGIHGSITQNPAPNVDSPHLRRLPLLLRRAWFGINQAFRRFSAQAGITPDQFTVLRTLFEHAPATLTQHELAEKMSSDPNTITSLLMRMEHGGLVERHPDSEDRRARRVWLKAAGLRAFAQARPLAAELQMKVLKSLPEPRREIFLQELETIAEACHQEVKSRR